MTGRCMSRKAGACCRMFAGHRDSHESWYGERWDDGDAAVADTTPETPAAQIAEALAPADLKYSEMPKCARCGHLPAAHQDGRCHVPDCACVAPAPLPALPVERLSDWFEATNQKLTTADGGRPPSYGDIFTDLQDGVRLVGFLLNERDAMPASHAPLPVDLARLRQDVEKERIAPVQGYKPGIPWSMHLRAYAAYCNQHGEQKALLDLDGKNCRGGFHVEELDEFIPSWREELTEAYHLRKRVEALEQERDGLSFNLDAAVDALANCQAKRDELQERAERAEAALTQLQEEVRLASNRASNRLMTPEKLAELLREPSHGQ
jgi:hypothetical protein